MLKISQNDYKNKKRFHKTLYSNMLKKIMFKISQNTLFQHVIVEVGPTKIEKKFVKSKNTLKLEKDSMM